MTTATTISTSGSKDVNSNDRVVPARIAHLVLRTTNVPPMAEWYKTVFHAEPVFDNGSMAFMYYDDEHHRIAIIEVPGLKETDPTASAIDHVAFSYDSIEDLLHTYDRLKRARIEPFAKLDHGMTTSFYYKDPDGNQIELQVDNFQTREEAHAYFTSEAFLNNPIGVEIDPDRMVKLLAAGEPPKNLLSMGTR